MGDTGTLARTQAKHLLIGTVDLRKLDVQEAKAPQSEEGGASGLPGAGQQTALPQMPGRDFRAVFFKVFNQRCLRDPIL